MGKSEYWKVYKLTKREKECLKYFIYKSSEIARIMGVKDSTAKTFITHTCQKLNAHSKGEAVIEALKKGILTLNDFLYYKD